MGKYEDRLNRTKWLKEARFGMFIHWGLYAELGGIWNGKSYNIVPGQEVQIIHSAEGL